jgi:hypothetical protein
VPVKKPSPSSEAARDLFDALRELYLRAGEPSMRTLARQCGSGVISYNTVHQVLTGSKLPKLGHVEVVVAQLGGDEQHFRELWIAARRAEDELRAGPEFPNGTPLASDNASHNASHDDNGAQTVAAARREAERILAEARAQAAEIIEQARSQAATLVAAPQVTVLAEPRSDAPVAPAEHRPLADELFLVGHDHRTGRAVISRQILDSGLVGAVLAELVLAERIAVTDGRLTVRENRLVAEPVTDYVLAAIFKQEEAHSVHAWVKYLREDVHTLVGQRLAAAGVVSRRAGRGPTLRSVIRYPAVDEVEAGAPAVRLGRYLIGDPELPDLKTAMLAALVHTCGLHAALAVDIGRQQVRDRMVRIVDSLPPPLTAIASGVDAAIASITLTVPR